MKPIKKLSVYLCILCLFPFAGNAQDNVVDEVVWVVGDDAILKSDVENMRLQMQYEGDRLPGDPYCVIPEQMALQKLYLHQAKLDSIIVTNSQVMPKVEQWINYVIGQIGSKEKMEEYFNKTLTQIREERLETLKEQSIVQEVQRKLIGEVMSTPLEVRKYYTQLPKDSLPFIPTTVEVQIVTIEPKIPIEDIDEIKARLREFSDRITKGESEFSTLARLWSEDTGTAMKGGELGFMGKGMLDPGYATVAFNLTDPKKVSKVTESEYGFHIIQLIEKRGDRINTRHILLKPKVSPQSIRNAILKLDSIAGDIKDAKFSFEDAAAIISYDKDTRNNKGLMVNNNQESQYASTSKFEMQELPQEIGQIVKDLNPGEISKSFKMINSKQKEVVAFVKLKSRTEGHKANLSDDYQTLKNIVENQKREEILKKWIAKKQKETYIRINEKWRNCDFQNEGWVKN
ncbi:MAG: peptidylprolyl isomerase [Dysgonamonadaceae bacterium]|jgi:peptidyl-prolyl cis-trans isomerase SurA|nr:peptidylprolyl isomerase [Dysgonamonadaceae bacterium]